METTLAIVVACIGSTGLFSFVQFMVKRSDEKDDKKESLEKEVKSLITASKESAIDRSRSQLLILICHFPDDTQAIISEAERYFLKLEGDSWMYGVLAKWAKEQKVNIDYLKAAHERNSNKK